MDTQEGITLSSGQNTPVKIMYLIDTYRHPFAGTESQLLSLINGLDDKKYETFLTIFRESDYIKENGFPCEVTVLNITHLTTVTSIRKILSFAFELRKNKFEIAHLFFNDSSIIAPIILKLMGIKVIVSRRDMGFWYNERNLRLLRINRFFVDAVVANSEAVKKHTHKMEKYPLAKIKVVYNGYDFTGVESESMENTQTLVENDKKIIGIVANIRPIKRIGDLVKAFSIVQQTHASTKLVIIGAGNNSDLKSLARDLGCEERVKFLGPQSQVLPLIKQFDVAVLCSESEGFSNSIIEYMQSAVPVVCTDTGGNSEIVVDGETRHLVDVGNYEQLASKIIAVLESPRAASNMAKLAYQKISALCDMKAMLRSQSLIYENLLQGDQNVR